MAVLKYTYIILLSFFLVSCKSNFYLHEDINDNNYSSLIAQKNAEKGDTLKLAKNIISVKDAGRYIKVGALKKGKETGKWYHYYITSSDTLDCYFIEKFTKADTIIIYGKSVNRNDW